MYFKLAWRNIWRNKRRTLITVASIFFAVILSTFMMSLKEGFYVNMIDTMIGDFTGYAQVHANGYWEDQNLENNFKLNDSLKKSLDNTEGLKNYVPRVESFALAAARKMTRGAMVVGIDPAKEVENIGLDEKVIAGDYLDPEDRAVLIGDGLADYLNISTTDTMVLLGQGYHGANAAGKYPVKGIVKFGSPELSKQLVFLPLQEAQWLYNFNDLLTNIILIPNDPGNTRNIVRSLRKDLSNEYEVMTWQELSPDLVNMIETDRMEGYVFMFILYMVITFGMFGTMLMMMAERKHEFGIMVAVGMKRFRLSVMVFTEVVIIALAGAFVGMLGAFPFCAYFYWNPIPLSQELNEMMEEYGFEFALQTSIAPDIFVQQAVVIFFIALVVSIYPVGKLLQLDAITAMHE